MLAGYRKAVRDAAAALPDAWTDERGQVRAQLHTAADAAQPPGLAAVAQELANLKRQGLLIGDEGAPGLVSAWELLAAAVRELLAYLSR